MKLLSLEIEIVSREREMTEVYFDIPVEVTNQLERKIAEAFQVYDYNNVDMVNARDIGAIVRSLGCVPTENDIQDLVKKTEFPNHPGDVHLSNFMPCLITMLVDKKMKSSSPKALFEAFKLLDEEDKGFIEKDEFIKIMRDVGESMTEDEISEMMKAAVDPTDQKIYYEMYINQLCHERKDSIYELVEDLHKPSGPRRKNKFL